MKIKLKRRRGIYTGLVCLVAAITISAVMVTGAASEPAPESMPDMKIVVTGPGSDGAAYPVPDCLPTPAPLPSAEEISRMLGTEKMWELKQRIEEAETKEERDALYEELLQERIKRGEISIREESGPATRGIETCIAGRTVKLPDDAELGGFIIDVWPPIGSTDNIPFLIIKRGNSTISIGVHTGVVIGGRIALGEEGAFDFLKEVFPEQREAIDSLPVKEPPPPIDWSTIELKVGGMPEVEE